MNSWLKITQVRIAEILNSDGLKQLKELTVSKEKVTTMMKDMVAEFNKTIEPKTAEKSSH